MNRLILLALLCINSVVVDKTHAQSIEDLRNDQMNLLGKYADLEAELTATQGEIDALQKEIDILSGWRKGLNGQIGFNLNKSLGWVANPNPRASTTSLNLGLTAYANYDKEKLFWHNKGIITESWQDVDKSDADRAVSNDGLFKNGVVDLFNISSLAGYRITDNFAFSGQAELNTSLLNFLSPGTMDIGVGATWIPMPNLTVMIHPFNYHYAFSGIDGLSSKGALGAKVRVDYYEDFLIMGKSVNWSSTLTSFFPYGNSEPQTVLLDPLNPDTSESFEAGLFEYTWLNTLSFEVWKGIGVGLAWGLRKSDFEGEKLSEDELPDDCKNCLLSGPGTQSYMNVGLSYNF